MHTYWHAEVKVDSAVLYHSCTHAVFICQNCSHTQRIQKQWIMKLYCSFLLSSRGSIGYHSSIPVHRFFLFKATVSAVNFVAMYEAIIPLSCGCSHGDGDCAAALVLMGDAYFPDRMVTHSWSNLYLKGKFCDENPMVPKPWT